MSLADEREQRRQEITDEIRKRQANKGQEGPLPAFLDFLTDHVIDTEIELAELRDQITNLRKTFVEHKHHLGGESHSQVMRRLDKAIKDVEKRLGRQGMSEEIDG